MWLQELELETVWYKYSVLCESRIDHMVGKCLRRLIGLAFSPHSLNCCVCVCVLARLGQKISPGVPKRGRIVDVNSRLLTESVDTDWTSIRSAICAAIFVE